MAKKKLKVGRPEKFNKKKVAEALIEWAQKDDSINLCAFCTTHDPLIPPSYLSDMARMDKDFSEAYQTAKLFLGARREEKLRNNELHVKAYDLNAAVYDYYLKEEKRQEKEFESSLKQNQEKESNEDLARNLVKAIKDSEEVS